MGRNSKAGAKKRIMDAVCAWPNPSRPDIVENHKAIWRHAINDFTTILKTKRESCTAIELTRNRFGRPPCPRTRTCTLYTAPASLRILECLQWAGVRSQSTTPSLSSQHCAPQVHASLQVQANEAAVLLNTCLYSYYKLWHRRDGCSITLAGRLLDQR